jgi:FkbM family methyltransferase
MKRFLRRVFRNVLPGWLKARYRSRLFGHRPGDVTIPLSFTQSGANCIATIGDSVRLVVTRDEEPNLRYHLQESGACIEEMAGFLREAEKARLLFDVGAHKGLFALVFAALNRAKRVVAYEPSPLLANRARELGELNGFTDRIEWRTEAIGDRTGSASFEIESTGFAAGIRDDKADMAVEVPITTLDAECNRLNARPDLLKIDIEGFEWEALQGGRNLLRNYQPIIFLELHLDALEERGIRPKQITDYLIGFDYGFRTPSGKQLRPRQIFDSLEPIVRLIAT